MLNVELRECFQSHGVNQLWCDGGHVTLSTPGTDVSFISPRFRAFSFLKFSVR